MSSSYQYNGDITVPTNPPYQSVSAQTYYQQAAAVSAPYDPYGAQGLPAGGPNRPFSPGGRPLKIYVANVGPQIKSFHLQEKFIQFGTITNIEVKPNLTCAFIEYTDADSAARAVAGGDGIELMGNILRVEAQKPRRARPRGPGMRDPYGMRGGGRMGRYLPYPDDYRRRQDMYGNRPYDYPHGNYAHEAYYGAHYGRPPASGPYGGRTQYGNAPLVNVAPQNNYTYGHNVPSGAPEYQAHLPYVSHQMPNHQSDYSQMQSTHGAYESGPPESYNLGLAGVSQITQPLISGSNSEAIQSTLLSETLQSTKTEPLNNSNTSIQDQFIPNLQVKTNTAQKNGNASINENSEVSQAKSYESASNSVESENDETACAEEGDDSKEAEESSRETANTSNSETEE